MLPPLEIGTYLAPFIFAHGKRLIRFSHFVHPLLIAGFINKVQQADRTKGFKNCVASISDWYSTLHPYGDSTFRPCVRSVVMEITVFP